MLIDHKVVSYMKVFKYLPEGILFLSTLIYLTLYILDDIGIDDIPSWFISIPVPYISSALMVFVFLFKG